MLVLLEVKLSSMVIFTVESTNPFNTFPCSADKGTVEPPDVKSSTISVILILLLIAKVFAVIVVSFVFTWLSKTISASFNEVTLLIKKVVASGVYPPSASKPAPIWVAIIRSLNSAISLWLSKIRGLSTVFTANKAKGTAVNGELLISVKVVQPSVLKSIFKFLGNKLHWISSKDAAYPPVLTSVPIIRLTIP